MQTFEIKIAPRGFWAAVVIPPVCYWTLVAVFASTSETDGVSVRFFLALLALAHALPLGALAWIWFSVAACSVTAQKLVLHAAARDREWDLNRLRRVSIRRGGQIAMEFDHTRFALRPDNLEAFLAAVTSARQEPLPITPPSGSVSFGR